jgi:hypothetical protein
MLAHLALVMAAWQAATTVKNSKADPNPWHDGEVFELRYADEGMTGLGRAQVTWKHEAAATLTVHRTAQGFALSLRGSRWWTGIGLRDCELDGLLQDQDAGADRLGHVSRMTLHPPPKHDRDPRDCADPTKLQNDAAALWNSIGMLSGVAKQQVQSHRHLPMPPLGPDGFVDMALSHDVISCLGGTASCIVGTVSGHFRGQLASPKPIDRTSDEELTIAPAGRVLRFHRVRMERSIGYMDRFDVQFRMVSPGPAPARPRPR